jgi:hypothetical protein
MGFDGFVIFLILINIGYQSQLKGIDKNRSNYRLLIIRIMFIYFLRFRVQGNKGVKYG